MRRSCLAGTQLRPVVGRTDDLHRQTAAGQDAVACLGDKEAGRRLMCRARALISGSGQRIPSTVGAAEASRLKA